MRSSSLRRRLRPRQLVVGGLVLVVVLVATLAILSGRSPNGPALPVEGPRVGSPAPTFSLASLRNPTKSVGLGKPNGRPTVVTFFASWCTDCRKDIGVLATSSRQLGSRVNFVGVDVADTRSAALAVLDKADLSYPIAFDPRRSVSGGLYDLDGLPSTVFVNGKGKLVHTVLGAITSLELTHWIGVAAA